MNLNDKRLSAYKKTAEGEPRAFSSGVENTKSEISRDSVSRTLDALRSASEVKMPSRGTGEIVTKMRTHIDDLMDRNGLLKFVKNAGGSEASAQAGAGQDSVYRRVAKFLLLIGVNEAAKVLPHLTPEQTERIIPEIASIRSVDKDEAAVIFAEFQSLLERSRQAGGVQTAFSILEKAFGSDEAERMFSKAVPFPDGTPFDYLQEISSDRLALLLKDETAPIRALVLSRLPPALAAAFIKTLDREHQKEVISRMAKIPAVSNDVIKRVDRAMREKLQTINSEAGSVIDGRGALAAILKKMDLSSEKSVLSLIAENDPGLSDDLRRRLFTVDDIINADDRFIQEILHEMDNGMIAILIAGKQPDFRDKILRNISKGRGVAVLEEEQLKRPIRKKDSDEVTDAFFSTLRRAWEDGKLMVSGRDDDVYV